jgi:hypothetical protein
LPDEPKSIRIATAVNVLTRNTHERSWESSDGADPSSTRCSFRNHETSKAPLSHCVQFMRYSLLDWLQSAPAILQDIGAIYTENIFAFSLTAVLSGIICFTCFHVVLRYLPKQSVPDNSPELSIETKKENKEMESASTKGSPPDADPVNQPWNAFLVLDVEGTCESGTSFNYPNEIIVKYPDITFV